MVYCYNCMNKISEGSFCTTCLTENVDKSIAHHLKPGTLLNNKYIVGNVIGEGGFGITYIGLDTTLDIRIAIKEYYPNGHVNRNHETTNNLTITEKERDFFTKGMRNFLIEAKSIAKFTQEKGVVDVRDYFEENNTAYIIMEYLDGQNLIEHTKQNGLMDAKELFRLMMPIMNSLQKMHLAGVIHRDISPDNIMYLKDGTLKLMDFGAARHFLNEENKMSVMLKKGYAPEEQYRKNGIQGPWTDVYGMCATIYRCVTGKIPDDALDRLYEDTLKKPSELGISISSECEAIIMYGLAIRKENRCSNMRELMEITDRLFTKASITPDTINSRSAPADRENLTMDATDISSPDIFNHHNQTISADDNELDLRPHKKETKKSSSSGSGIIIAMLIVLCMLMIAAFTIYLIKDTRSNSSSESSSETSNENDEKSDDTKATEEEDITETEEVDAKVDEEVEVVIEDATSFTHATASSTLPNQKNYNYSASNVLTDDTNCWVEGATGLGIGEWIKLDLPKLQRVKGIKIINGYAGTAKQYTDNGKVTKVLIEFSDGRSVSTNLTVFHENDRNTIQYIELNQAVETMWVKITIQNAVGGVYEDTCITYIAPY